MEALYHNLIGSITSIVIVVIGGAVAFGKIKEKCKNNDGKIEKLEKDLGKRVENLEDTHTVSVIECDRRSKMYKDLMCTKIDQVEKVVLASSEIAEKHRDLLSNQVMKNREDTMAKYDRINLFVGEAKAII